jgi:uncharacterized membrane protein YbhN (UPF0104 family)
MNLRAAAAWLRRNSWARGLVTLACLLGLWLALPKEPLFETWRSLRADVLAATLLGYLSLHLVAAWKWHWLARRLGTGIPAPASVRAYFLGLFGNLFLPTIMGGDAVTVVSAMQSSSSKTSVLLTGLLNRVADLAALLLLAASVLAWSPSGLGVDVRTPVFAAAGFGIAVISFAALSSRVREFARSHPVLLEFRRRPQDVLFLMALSVVVQLGLLALSAWLAGSAGLHVPLAGWLFAWPLAKLAGMLPVSVAGFGPRDMALAALLAPFGAPYGGVIATAVAWDGVMVAGGLAAGAIGKALDRPARAQVPRA